MRPIHLSIAGLHSFREKQEIDFQALCAGGVFGIFGPTGSGKSTILDAITLALYGKVERATNNTQGIMNHAEEQLSVSFTFQLGKHDHVQRYRVERAFKRTGDITIRTSTCRLVEQTLAGEEVVLADKERDVTAAIGQLLGLTIDDFTRAVVLPQGKFAEFLSLKGVERRQMLQRLFHLEQYGDRLNNRLKQRVEHVRGVLEQIKAEQQGLGDASSETITALSKLVDEARKQVEEQKTKLQQLEKQYEEKKQVWQLQEELSRAQTHLAQLQTEEQAIQMAEATLKRAREAAALKPYAEEWRQAQEALKHWQNQATLLQKEVATALENYHQKQKVYETAKQKRVEQEPKLLVREEQLKQAQQIEAELSQAKAEAQQLSDSMQQLAGQQNIQEQNLQKEKAQFEKALSRQQELKKQLAELQVPAELRVQLRKASEAKQGILYQEQQVKELQREREEQFMLLKQEKGKQEQLVAQITAVEGKLAKQYTEASHIYQQMKQLADSLGQAQQIITEEIKAEQEALEEEHHQQLAYQLAHALQEGVPCPVCGSAQHPQPNKGTGKQSGALEQRRQRIGRLEEVLRESRDAQQELARYSYQLEQLVEALQEAAPVGVNAPSSTSIVMEPVVPPTDVDKLLTVCQTYQQKLMQIEEQIKQHLKDAQEIQSAHKEQSQTLRTIDHEVKELERKMNKLNESIQSEEKKWQQAYPTLAYEQLEAEQSRIDGRDQQVTDINQRLELSVTYITEREQAIQRAQTELNQLQLNRVELKTKSTALQKQIFRLEAQLQDYLGEEAATHQECKQIENNEGRRQVDSDARSISLLLKQVSTQLQELITEEQRSHEEFLAQQKILQTKEQEHGIAKESFKQAQLRQEQTEAKWHEQTKESIFANIEELFQALLSKEAQDKLKERVNGYRDQEKQALQEQARLTTLLQGNMITLEEWQKLREELEAVKLQRDEALQLFAKATRDLEDMQERHARFQELAEKRLKFEHKEEQLGKLSAVFRGNSFVEFVATEQLIEVSRDASYRLGQLTRQRYALEVDSNLGFVIRDDHNGGFKRPISSLSGGETFLTSLALALALSAQIQLRGEYPLEFFFLDEGFGTLDQELLDTVIDALEKLHTDHLSVGVISHVPELKARLPRQLIVQPESAGQGSRVSMLP